MTYLYSIDWKKVPVDEFLKFHNLPTQQERRRRVKRIRPDPVLDNPNVIAIRVTCLDELGNTKYITKLYEEWLGVCTKDIESLVREMNTYLPGINIRYEKLYSTTTVLHKNVLPYFADKLKSGDRLLFDAADDEEGSPFYKLYVNDCAVEEVGHFFKRLEIAYYEKCDWPVRLYIDFCKSPQQQEEGGGGFFYRWYRVDPVPYRLEEAFQLCRKDNNSSSPPPPPPMTDSYPNWCMAAFDIETVPGPPPPDDDDASFVVVDRIPDGTDPGDRIVMISIVTWDDRGTLLDEKVLYLNPLLQKKNFFQNPKYLEYESEIDLLHDFHYFIRNCHVLTGYNINNFDFPCIFARLLFLKRWDLLASYTSRSVGAYRIITYENKIVLDLYHYFRIFSDYDLTSYKLDAVAETKLASDAGNRKIAVDSVGIHAWYNYLGKYSVEEEEAIRLCLSNNTRECYEALVVPNLRTSTRRMPPLDRFGTFSQYVEYCLRDSQLVRQLFMKETVLYFFIARCNFAAVDVVQSMHYGNSRFLLEVFRSYGTTLGFFVNMDFLENRTDGAKYQKTFVNGKYQGALNFCQPEKFFEDVVLLDFASMYPVSLLSSNLCYGTCDILTTEEYGQLDETIRQKLTTIPYRTHPDSVFIEPEHETYRHLLRQGGGTYEFRYPPFDPEKDEFVIVVDQTVRRAFLPTLVKHFLGLRKHHQREWKRTRNVVHYNFQLCIKLLINSLYGTMGSKESPLAYLVVAIAIATLARYQLLGSFHFMQDIMGYNVCYVDTDSLMVHKWPHDECDSMNRFFGRTLPYVELKFEERMRRLLVLSKKRYVYVNFESDRPIKKGFDKKVNGLVKFMSDAFVKEVMDHHHNQTGNNFSKGWEIWIRVLLEGLHMCSRDPRKYAVTRKTRKLSEYVSTTCPAVKMLKKYPEKEGGYIDYAFSRADVAENREGDWLLSVEDCQYVNFEKLFVNQKKIFYTLLNIAFWKMENPEKACNAVLNTIHWRYFVHAEILNYNATTTPKQKIVMLVEKGVTYTFKINDHCFKKKEKKINQKTVKKRI